MKNLTTDQFIDLFGNCFNPVKGEYAPMDLTPKYLEIFNDFDKHRYNIILKKTRQTGLTNLMMLYAAYVLLTGEDKTIIYTSNRFDIAKNFIRRLKDFLIHNNLEENFGPTNSVSRLDFNSNRIIGVAATPDALRGYNTDVVLIDEAAFIKNLKDFFTCIIPSVAVGGRIIIGSTPNGYETFEGIWSAENHFNKHSLHWTDTTRFDDKWYEDMCKTYNNNKLIIRQELDGEFIDFVEEKSKTLSVRVTDELYSNINRQLLISGESTSDYIRRLIQEDINRH